MPVGTDVSSSRRERSKVFRSVVDNFEVGTDDGMNDGGGGSDGVTDG